VKGFCKNVVLTGIGFTVLPDIMMMFSSPAETTCGRLPSSLRHCPSAICLCLGDHPQVA
jgi:hypothetical protein